MSAPAQDDFVQVAGSWDGFLIACDRCRRAFDPDTTLFATVGHLKVCARCWKLDGRPFPRAGDISAVHEAEIATRARMVARGGAHAHLVRKGLT
jgi:hypothetical protein